MNVFYNDNDKKSCAWLQKLAKYRLLRGYGNAIVPQVAAVFIKAVMQYLRLTNPNDSTLRTVSESL